MRRACSRRLFCGLIIVALMAPMLSGASPAVPDFCFIQISDIHIGPIPRTMAVPNGEEGLRSVDTIKWLCAESKQVQRLEPMGITTPLPAFVINTGDSTEYGVIGKTWGYWEQLFKPLGLPLYITPGNHDNTWTSLTPTMRKRHGGDCYSFEKFGCHFAGIDSAAIQEPLPCLEARILNWLREDLKSVPKDRPVFIFQHHNLSSEEFAGPLEQLELLDALRGHNVVLLLMGHGHSVRAERWNTLDSVMGGSTFGPNSGYSIISVLNGVLRVVYRYKDAKKPMQKLLEKPIAPREPVEVQITRPEPAAMVTGSTIDAYARMIGATPRKMVADIDGGKSSEMTLTESLGFMQSLSLSGVLPGRHYLHVKTETDAGPIDRAAEFVYAPPTSKIRAASAELAAGMKAGAVAVEDGCVVVTTAGEVARITFNGTAGNQHPAAVHTLYKTGVEIIHPPTLVDGTLYFSSAERGVFSLGLNGKLNWKRPMGAAVYGTPAVVGDTVYVGDMEGSVHAIDRQSGKLKWSKPHAIFSIEMPLMAHADVLYFGAWDGFVYAVNAADGSLKWKQPGPAGQTGKPGLRSRYYSPADCAPVVVGDRVFVTDRAYRLGSYSLDGKYLGQIASGVSAIGPTEDGKGIYSRTLEKGVTRYDAEGKPVWTRSVQVGHYATPPTATGGKVCVCGNYGVVSVLDAGTGEVLWQYSVTPHLHVMGGVAADGKGNVYAVGMDGVVMRLRNG